MPTVFGKWLHQQRTTRGLTLAALQDKTGIAYTHISQLESGRSRPSRETALLFAAALEADGNDALLTAAYLPYGEPHFMDQETQRLAKRLYRLSPKARAIVENAICNAEALTGSLPNEGVMMADSCYSLTVHLQLTTRAVSREAAVDHAGQIIEQLAIRMARVLTRLEITRHDVGADFGAITQIGDDPTNVERTSTLAFPFRVPLQATVEMRAESPDAAVAKIQELLGSVPEQMSFVLEKYSVSDLDAQIAAGPTLMQAFPQTPVPKTN